MPRKERAAKAAALVMAKDLDSEMSEAEMRRMERSGMGIKYEETDYIFGGKVKSKEEKETAKAEAKGRLAAKKAAAAAKKAAAEQEPGGVASSSTGPAPDPASVVVKAVATTASAAAAAAAAAAAMAAMTALEEDSGWSAEDQKALEVGLATTAPCAGASRDWDALAEHVSDTSSLKTKAECIARVKLVQAHVKAKRVAMTAAAAAAEAGPPPDAVDISTADGRADELKLKTKVSTKTPHSVKNKKADSKLSKKVVKTALGDKVESANSEGQLQKLDEGSLKFAVCTGVLASRADSRDVKIQNFSVSLFGRQVWKKSYHACCLPSDT